MLGLSTPSDTSERVADRRALRVLTVVIPALVAAGLAGVVLVDRPSPLSLRVMAPDAGRAGRTLPLRAVVLDAALDAPPPSAVIDARLVERGSSAVLASARLVPSASQGVEGGLALPVEVPGPVDLEVRARVAGGEVIVHRRRLALEPVDAPPGLRPRVPPAPPRPLPVRRIGEALPPDRLSLRVEGGACVPELPCRLLAEVGRPPARLALEVVRGEGQLQRVGPDGGETEGVVAFEARIASADAAVDLVALRGGVEVARREVELPLALGAPSVRVEGALHRASERPAFVVRALDPRRGFAVDLHRDDRWELASSLAAPDPVAPMGAPIHAILPAPLEPGLYRLSVRASPFDVAPIARDLFFVGPGGATEAELLEGLARRVGARDGGPSPRPVDSDLEVEARFLLAPLAAEPVELPRFRGSAGAETEGAWLRRVVAALVLALGVLAAAILLARGLAAGRAARTLLLEADAPLEEVAADARRSRLSAVGASLFVLAVFGAVAWIVLARGCA